MLYLKRSRLADTIRTIKLKFASDKAALQIAATKPHLIAQSEDPLLRHHHASLFAPLKPDIGAVLDAEERVLRHGEVVVL